MSVSTVDTPVPGKYRHYKGQLYEVIGNARHSETEEWLVYYRCLYGDYSCWVRPREMFLESVEIDGEVVPRFQLIGSDASDACAP